MIGMRHEKTNDLSFQNEHDGSVAHKTKNKVPFDSTKINVMYTYDKDGNEKRTEYYRMKFKQDWGYAEKYLQTGELKLEDMKFAKNVSAQDKQRRYEYLRDLFNKLDKDKLQNGLDNFKNAPALSKWYLQQEKNKRQSAKKTHGKAEHKTIQPFMTNVIFFGKEDIELGNNMNKEDLDNRVKSFIGKFQEKYNIPKESIRISRHEDESHTHFHYTFLNWNEKTKHFNNKEMSSPHIIQEHLDMLENEFKDVLVKTRTKYTESKKERHKPLTEYNAELVSESKTKAAELDKISSELDNEKEQLTKTKDTIIRYIDKKKELIDVNKKLHNENAEQNFTLIENITNNKQSELELKKIKKQEQELTDKLEQAKINLELQKKRVLNDFTQFSEKVFQHKDKFLTEVKANYNEHCKKLNHKYIEQSENLKSENELLTTKINASKIELQELENDLITVAEIKDNKVGVSAYSMDKVVKEIDLKSEAKIILLLNKIEQDHNIKINFDKRDEYKEQGRIKKADVFETLEKFVTGFKATLDKLSAITKKAMTFGLNRNKNIDRTL